jgi:hypothetical protein
MTAIKQAKPERVDEQFLTVRFINPTETIKLETIQTITDLYKSKFNNSVAEIVVEPTIKECRQCSTKSKNT